MRLIQYAAILAAGLALGPAHADYVLRDSASVTQTVKTFTCGDKICLQSVPATSDGSEIDHPTSAKQDTGNTALAAILAKITSDPATQTTLAAILAKLSSDPATQTTLAALVSANHTDLAAILAKLTSDPATQTTLAAVLAKLTSDPSTATLQTTTNTNLGAPGATACATDIGSCSGNALWQRIAQRLSSLITALGTPLQAGGNVVVTSAPTTAVTIATAPVLVAGAAIIGKVGIDQTTPGTTNGVVNNPTSAAGSALTPVTTSALAANQVIKASAGNLYGFQVSADSTLSGAAWWIMVYDATSAPVDGAVTPKKCYAQPSGTTGASYAWPLPIAFATGIVVGVSTTGCFSKTASTHAFISGDAQ